MPEEQVHLVVRKALVDLEAEIRGKYGVRGPLLDVAIEHDALVLTFEGAPLSHPPANSPRAQPNRIPAEVLSSRKRHKHRVRNRMKTRGWDVVAKFVNSRGQSCTIYRPFYEALVQKKGKRREAYSAVREILLSNGNSPKPSSVDYFLDNTLEFIRSKETNQGGGGSV